MIVFTARERLAAVDTTDHSIRPGSVFPIRSKRSDHPEAKIIIAKAGSFGGTFHPIEFQTGDKWRVAEWLRDLADVVENVPDAPPDDDTKDRGDLV